MKSFDLIKPYYRTHRRVVVIGLGALMVVNFLQLSIPRVIKWVVDDLTVYETDLTALVGYAGIIVLLGCLIGVFRYIWRRCLLGTARQLEASLRNRLVGHIQKLSAGYFDGVKTGDLMAHASNDINQVRMAAGMGLVAFNDAVVLGTAAIGFMLYIHVQLTLYVLIPMPFIVLGTRLLGRKMHQRYQAVQASFSELTEAVRECLAGIRLIKAHNGSAFARRSVTGKSQDYVNQNIRLVGITGLFFPLMMLFTNLSMAIVLLLGGRGAVLAEITPGDFVAFISYLNLLTWPMMALGWVTNLIQRGGASLERLNVILQRRPDIQDRPDSRGLDSVRGRMTFEDVVFSYPQNPDKPVLDHLSLTVPAGGMMGVVGPPGSGKTTLLTLIPRLYDVDSGRVLVDGRDVRAITLEDLRRQIAYAPQEPFLFAGTVRDNLLFGCGPEGGILLEQVLEDTGLAETVASFPRGLDTIVGEKGILLSGGQKQRIGLARALMTDRPILLLDDPISQVDMTTGRHIVNRLRRWSGRKTIVIVSHRLSAVQSADTIVVLDNGKIAEAGDHQTLLAVKGYYAGVHAMQELENAV